MENDKTKDGERCQKLNDMINKGNRKNIVPLDY